MKYHQHGLSWRVWDKYLKREKRKLNQERIMKYITSIYYLKKRLKSDQHKPSHDRLG